MNVKKTKKFKENRPENYHVHDRDPPWNIQPPYNNIFRIYGQGMEESSDRWRERGGE